MVGGASPAASQPLWGRRQSQGGGLLWVGDEKARSCTGTGWGQQTAGHNQPHLGQGLFSSVVRACEFETARLGARPPQVSFLSGVFGDGAEVGAHVGGRGRAGCHCWG